MTLGWAANMQTGLRVITEGYVLLPDLDNGVFVELGGFAFWEMCSLLCYQCEFVLAGLGMRGDKGEKKLPGAKPILGSCKDQQ